MCRPFCTVTDILYIICWRFLVVHTSVQKAISPGIMQVPQRALNSESAASHTQWMGANFFWPISSAPTSNLLGFSRSLSYITWHFLCVVFGHLCLHLHAKLDTGIVMHTIWHRKVMFLGPGWFFFEWQFESIISLMNVRGNKHLNVSPCSFWLKAGSLTNSRQSSFT